MNERIVWYLARGSGITAWALLALAVLLGLALSGRPFGKRVPPPWLLEVHRHLGGVAVLFTVTHVAALMADETVAFGWLDVLVPFASTWRPSAVAWGVIAFWLLAVVEGTALARKHLPKLWKRLHWLSLPLYGVATAHLLTAGTDARNRLLLAAVQLSLMGVAVLTAARVLPILTRKPGSARRTANV